MKDSLNIVIAGATGYVGLELTKILSKHPKSNILYLCATKSIGKSIQIFDKSINSTRLPKISKINKVDWTNVDILFTALPNGEAQKIAKKIPENIKIIDLSADFRLNDYKLYKKWYGINHSSKNLIKKSTYAITEFSKEKLSKYRIIACAGCYPTSIQIPLIPLIQKKMIKIKNIIVDSKSGYSGAGRKLAERFRFKKLFKSVSAYGIGSHRHMAEIDQELSKVSKSRINISFTPHLIPIFRGILSTIYIDAVGNNDAKRIYNYLKKYHKNGK